MGCGAAVVLGHAPLGRAVRDDGAAGPVVFDGNRTGPSTEFDVGGCADAGAPGNGGALPGPGGTATARARASESR